MNNFNFYLLEGLKHISDVNAYDHILFILALSALYNIKEVKKLIGLITAFTVGHSIALILATFSIVKVNASFIEFLIPVSIIATCASNIYEQRKHQTNLLRKFTIIIFFGLIHGLGFSNYLRFLLTKEESIFTPLLGFNIGLELGQLLILSLILVINFLFLKWLKISQGFWAILISILVAIITIPILINTGKALLNI